MSKQQVQKTFGSPQSIVTNQVDGMLVETWKYLDRAITFQDDSVLSVEEYEVGIRPAELY